MVQALRTSDRLHKGSRHGGRVPQALRTNGEPALTRACPVGQGGAGSSRERTEDAATSVLGGTAVIRGGVCCAEGGYGTLLLQHASTVVRYDPPAVDQGACCADRPD